MNFECTFSTCDSGWSVEAIDSENDGVVYRAFFTGPYAEQRAYEYMAWKNAANKSPRHQSEKRKFAA
jgi:hypothetical protein